MILKFAQRLTLSAMTLVAALAIAAPATVSTADAADHKPKTEKMSKDLEKALKKEAKKKLPGADQTTVVTYRDLKGKEVQMTNPDLDIQVIENVQGLTITADTTGFDTQGKRITKVVPGVTIHAEGSDCFWYCQNIGGSITCWQICVP